MCFSNDFIMYPPHLWYYALPETKLVYFLPSLCILLVCYVFFINGASKLLVLSGIRCLRYPNLKTCTGRICCVTLSALFTVDVCVFI